MGSSKFHYCVCVQYLRPPLVQGRVARKIVEDVGEKPIALKEGERKGRKEGGSTYNRKGTNDTYVYTVYM